MISTYLILVAIWGSILSIRKPIISRRLRRIGSI